MTDRGATSAVLTEIANPQIRQAHLFTGVWPDGTVYYTDLPFNITVDGDVYLALGNLLAYDAIEESATLDVGGVDITFAGSDATILALVDGQNLSGRKTTIKRIWLDSSNALIADPITIFQGKSDEVNYEEVVEHGGESYSAIKIRCKNQFADFERVSGRRTNDVEQKRYFPGDRGMEFVADLVAKVVQWKQR